MNYKGDRKEWIVNGKLVVWSNSTGDYNKIERDIELKILCKTGKVIERKNGQ